MTIGIFGLGYVGLTTAACLLDRKFKVVGFEVSDEKRRQLLAGRSPLSEPGVEESILSGLSDGSFVVRADLNEGAPPDLVFVCVGTPSRSDGSTDLRAVEAVFAHLDQIAQTQGSGFATEVVLRSTVPPGTLRALQQGFPGLFGAVPVVFYPEFLREGVAKRDFFQPPQTVLGRLPGGLPPRRLPTLLAALSFEYELVDSLSAESLKFACNAYHAIKVAFGNEIGRITNHLGGDGREVMRLFLRDTILNVSPRYLLPGAPYGGSCLPKDTRAYGALARKHGVNLPLLDACEPSNQAHVDFIAARVRATQARTVTVLGLAFKRDTDDVRESPSIALVRKLVSEAQLSVRLHDFLVQPGRVVGVNREVLNELLALPRVTLHSTLTESLSGAQAIVLMHDDPRYEEAMSAAAAAILHVARWRPI